MAVQDELEVAATDRRATVLSTALVLRADEQKDERRKIAHQRHEFRELVLVE